MKILVGILHKAARIGYDQLDEKTQKGECTYM